jgi:hypothetical protein
MLVQIAANDDLLGTLLIRSGGRPSRSTVVVSPRTTDIDLALAYLVLGKHRAKVGDNLTAEMRTVVQHANKSMPIPAALVVKASADLRRVRGAVSTETVQGFANCKTATTTLDAIF